MGNVIRALAHATLVIGGMYLLSEAMADLKADKRALEDECDRLARDNEKLKAESTI